MFDNILPSKSNKNIIAWEYNIGLNNYESLDSNGFVSEFKNKPISSTTIKYYLVYQPQTGYDENKRRQIFSTSIQGIKGLR